jgi:glycosyltransferase involved in cell wall biosynthesis
MIDLSFARALSAEHAAPEFSVIVVDYEGTVSRDEFRRAMRSLAEQTRKDFEVLVYHDGPKEASYADDLRGEAVHSNTRFFVTETRENNWGHGNRDRGIRAARGAWIITTNADNVFYPRLIEELHWAANEIVPAISAVGKPLPLGMKVLAKQLDRYAGTTYLEPDYVETTERQILIFPVLMCGLVPAAGRFHRRPDRARNHAIVLGGIPVMPGNIDAMQFVMRRDLWLAEGGWYDLSERSDGEMYKKFARKYHVRAVPAILGEHW